MITLTDVHKSYRSFGKVTHVLRGISCSIPSTMNLGILGANGSGKSTLVRLLAGMDAPDKGSIDFGNVRMSWPIGRSGAQMHLTARDNIKFIARIYGLHIEETIDFVMQCADLGKHMDLPVSTYSARMRARLAFAMSLVPEFDCYLVDEGFSAGDTDLAKRMVDMFDERRKTANMICVTQSLGIIRRYCDTVAILDGGKLTMYDDMNEAIKVFESL